MTGRPYTMRELKMIVDYLTQHNAYGEIKGRKMWIDFANSQSTTRSWQSLKETFLKRILPDIHNPYYKLTMEQIRSFRQGHDVTIEDKLEIRSNDEGKNNKGDVQKDNEQPGTSNINEQKATTGENLKNSKTPSNGRSSTDTLIIGNCYDTAEDIQKELEDGKKTNDNEPSPTKSMRDLITYSEPLTPMLQAVLDDFATDDEDENSDKEPQMQIVEDCSDQEKNHGSKSPNEIVHPENIQTDVIKNTEKSPSPVLGETSNENKICENHSRNESSGLNKVNDSLKSDNKNTKDTLNPKNVTEKNKTNVIINSKENIAGTFGMEPNSEKNDILSNITNDTTLPNNQEAFKNKIASREIPIHSSHELQSSKELSQEKGNLTRKRFSLSGTKGNAEHNKRLRQDKTKQSSITESGSELPVKKNVNDLNHENNETNNLIRNREHTENKTVDTNNVENKHDTANKEMSANEKDNSVCQIVSNCNSEELLQDDTVRQVKVNPCLQSVNLYEEQFSQRKYSDSEASNRNEGIVVDKQINQDTTKIQENIENKNTNREDNPKNLEGVVEDVVILKSHSESESVDSNVNKVRRNNLVTRIISQSQKNKALANVFGFSSGNLCAKRRRRFSSHRRSSCSYRDSRSNIHSDSNEWTSESDGEYISPPRARKNRHTRKHLKPQSARILSLEEEGGLFVMYNEKIYPLVRDGKILKKYLKRFSDSDEEDESYWKKKYLEKKKKIEELTRKLELTKSSIRRTRQDSLQENSVPNSTTGLNQDRGLVNGAHQNVEREENISKQDKTVKIILTKDKSELQLDGNWQHIPPMLQQVVQILRTDLDAHDKEVPSTSHIKPPARHQLKAPVKKQFKASDKLETPNENQIKAPFPTQLEAPINCIEISSGKTTPTEPMAIDKEVSEKVNEIEMKIFKEIQQRDKTEETNDDAQQSYVTLRKRPLRSNSISTPASPSKRPKTAKDVKQSRTLETNNKLIVTNSNTDVTKRRTRSPKVQTDNNVKPEEPRIINTRILRKLEPSSTKFEDKSNVLYKFPSPSPQRKSLEKTDTNTKKKTNVRKINKTYTTKITQTSFSYDSVSFNSIESSQGYQDSDISLTSACHKRRKRRRSHSVLTNRGKYFHRSSKKTWHPYLTDDLSSESSSSFSGVPIKSITRNSTLDTEIYKSDSYQLLMPKVKSSLIQLEKIDENCPVSADNISDENSCKEIGPDSFHRNADGGTSSNVSLPLSPELSIVENISISKESLANIEQRSTINETQGKYTPEGEINNQYRISKLDASMPLMEQECRFQETYRPNVLSDTTAMDEPKYIHCSINQESMDCNSNIQKSSLVSESLLEKICTVNINESSSDLLDQKLQELILESAKKATKQGIGINDKVTTTMENKGTEMYDIKNNTKLKTTKKRCSTPRKKKNAKKTKIPDIEPVIEEEHMESCSFVGRKYLPSPVQVLHPELNTMNGETNAEITTIVKSKNIKKKDIIKVKILKPKRKKKPEITQDYSEVLNILDEIDNHRCTLEINNRSTLKRSNISLYTSNVVNDTESGVFLHQDFNNSTQLIHNHSDTCLHANECLRYNVEFAQNNSQSVISLILNTTNSSKEENDSNLFKLSNEKHKSESFCKNSQLSSLSGEAEYLSANNLNRNSASSKSAVYYTPLSSIPSPDSLITEDQSDEIQPSTPSNWYLLSEDENSNTNFLDIFPRDASNDRPSFGANLNHLFPITCAVPNLSTITEISKEADENSQQKTDARGIQSDTHSQSIFDSND